MKIIDTYTARSGRVRREDDTVVNEADGINLDGSRNVVLKGSNVTDVTFHDVATVAANGTPLTVGGNKTLTVEIYGTSTSRTVTFYGKSVSGTLRSISGVRLSDFATAASTTGNAEIWQFDITGLTSVTMDLTAVAGGNVSVKGRFVA